MRGSSLVALSLGLLFSAEAHASCLNPSADSRLRTYCVTETLKDRMVTLGDAQVLDLLLKREGYARGLGLSAEVRRKAIQPFIAPIFEYSANINAGNPDRPLVLGELTFFGAEESFRKEGVVAGIAAGVSGRHIYGEGRYLDFSAGVSYAHSPRHDIGIARAFANICSRNHIQNNWFMDGCASTTRLNRDLKNETKSNLTLSTTKLFSASRTVHHAATIGLQRYFEHGSYQQNQLLLGWQTVRSDSFYNSINVTLGGAVTDTLATRHSVSTTLGTTLFDRALTATVSYSYADGGRLFGVDRNDTTIAATLNYAVHPRVSLNIGYKRTNSSIDYFSEREPIIGVQVAPWRF